MTAGEGWILLSEVDRQARDQLTGLKRSVRKHKPMAVIDLGRVV